jgi:THO complex subunit 4
MLYDRMDRSQGTAFITYLDPRDARDAMREYDGANAQGQPIRLTLLPTGPAADVRGPPPPTKGSLFERVERPTRSLFDRIDNDPASSRDDSRGPVGRRGGGRGGRQDRSYSPEKGRYLGVPENIDRYVPGHGGGRGARRGDEQGRPSGRRPIKTAEQLDAEMDDYFGGGGGQNSTTSTVQNGSASTAPAASAAVGGDDDIDMVE